jgi:hypothetical protein
MSEEYGELVYRLCPHWWRPITHPLEVGPIMYEITAYRKCRICGKVLVHARLPEPSDRTRADVLAELHEPGWEVVADAWVDRERVSDV